MIGNSLLRPTLVMVLDYCCYQGSFCNFRLLFRFQCKSLQEFISVIHRQDPVGMSLRVQFVDQPVSLPLAVQPGRLAYCLLTN